MPAADALTAHLEYREPDERIGQQYSSFTAALRDAREATGRDADSGELIKPKRIGNWLGGIAYIILLEHIGNCFSPRGASGTEREKGVVSALQSFGGVDRRTARTINALRNAFVHEFGLCNPQTRQHFTLGAGCSWGLVGFPSLKWDGNYTHRAPGNATRVDLWELAETTERIVARIRALASNDELDVRLAGGTDELLGRFGMRVIPPA